MADGSSRTGGDIVLVVGGVLILAGLAMLLFGQAFVLPCDGDGIAYCDEAEWAVRIGFGVFGAAALTLLLAFWKVGHRPLRRLVIGTALVVAFATWVVAREVAQRPDELGLG